jgi:hypothetical protein
MALLYKFEAETFLIDNKDMITLLDQLYNKSISFLKLALKGLERSFFLLKILSFVSLVY